MKKALHRFTSSKHRKSAIEEHQSIFDYSDNSDDDLPAVPKDVYKSEEPSSPPTPKPQLARSEKHRSQALHKGLSPMRTEPIFEQSDNHTMSSNDDSFMKREDEEKL